MQIGSIPPVLPTSAAKTTVVQPQPPAKTQQEAPKPVPFDPSPALRPTIQDRIDVNRTLLALRQL